ncbi:MAG: hypothetical protein N3A58_03975 [Spirochaetes bacterium]|nr:hypothetical protein [Spirochaetota bacterium]
MFFFNFFKKYFHKILKFYILTIPLIFFSCTKLEDNFNSNKKFNIYKNCETIYLSLNRFPENLNPFIKGNINENIIKNLLFDSIIYIEPKNLKLYSNYLEKIIFDLENNKVTIKFLNNSLNINLFLRQINFLIKNINNSEGIKLDYLNKIKLNQLDENSLEVEFLKKLEIFEINQTILNLLSCPILSENIILALEEKSDNFYKIFTPEKLKGKYLTGPYFIDNVSSKTISLKLNKNFKNPSFEKILLDKYIESTNLVFTIYKSFEEELNDFLIGNLDIIYFNDENLLTIFKKFPASIGLIKILNPYNNLHLINNLNFKQSILFNKLKLDFSKEYEKNNFKIFLPYIINKNNNNSRHIKVLNSNKNNILTILSQEKEDNNNNQKEIILLTNNDEKIINLINNSLKNKNINYQISIEDSITFIAKIYGNLQWNIAFISLSHSLWNLPDLDFFNPYSYGHIVNLSNTKKVEEINIFSLITELWDIRNYFIIKKGILIPNNKKLNSIIKDIQEYLKKSEMIYPIYYKPVFIAYNKKLRNLNPLIYNNLIDYSFPKMIYLRKKK